MEELVQRVDAQAAQIKALTETVFLLVKVLAQRDAGGAAWALDRIDSARVMARMQPGVDITADSAAILDGVERLLQGRAI